MSIPISQLTPGGLPNGNIELPATNPLNLSQSINGTTLKYNLVDILQYILIAQGFTTYTSCRVATTAALTATYANGVAGVGATLTNSGAQVGLQIDGVTLALNDRVLIKNQTNTFENGIYVVSNIGNLTTNWVLTRADDYNQPAEIVYLGVVAITQGTQNAGLIFQENSQGPFVIGTSPITFQQLQIDITLLPSASPANKILRSDGTYWVQSTNASLDSSDKLYNLSELQVDNININGNSITSTDVGGNIVITPNTVGSIVLDGLNWPQVDGTANQALVTNGAGQLGWASFGAPFTPAALTSTSDSNVTITLGGTPLTALLQATSITMGWSGLLPISRGGTNTSTLGSAGQLAQSDGTKYAWTTATYPATATATGTILRADGTNWVATTATYPATTTINQILYSSANNVISEITTANSAALVTNASGVPSFTSSMTDGQLVIGSTGATPVVGSITGSGSITVTPGAGTIQISSSAGGVVNPGTANELAYYATTGSAVSGLASANNGVLVTSGTGVPSISSTLPTAVQSNITSVGTIGSGTWQGNTIAVGYGGTGATSVGANGTLAQSNGSIYTFTTATYPSTTTANQLLYSSATNTVGGLASANSATLVTNASGVPAWTGSMTNGQILIGSTGATPVPATITGTAGITVTNGAGSITISGGGGGYTWTEVTGTSQTMAANNGYITNNPALVTLTLPTTAALGTTLSIAGKGAGGWKIAQNAGQEIFFGSSATTIGVTGYLQSTQQFDSIELLCITADTQWTVITGPQGAITVA
jgi:hypothetical protein